MSGTSAYLKTLKTRNVVTPLTEPLPNREKEMTLNSSGVFTFELNTWNRLERFLILGADNGTYYIGERNLIKENHDAVLKAIAEDSVRTVKLIEDISVAGRARKQDATIVALACVITHANDEGKKAAEAAFNSIIRTGTHLLTFVACIQAFGKWNRRTRRIVSNWYLLKDDKNLAYQMIKYRNRAKVTHFDVLSLAHTKPSTETQKTMFSWAKTKQIPEGGKTPLLLEGFQKANETTSGKEWAKLIETYGLTREMLPPEALQEKVVWEALSEEILLTALIRNLGIMTNVGIITPLSDTLTRITSALTDETRLKKERVHPMSLLLALKVYQTGKGVKGSVTWTPNSQICDALDEAFYKAFKFVEPTGQKLVLAIDCSDSMTWAENNVAKTALQSREAAGAMALVTASVEKSYHIMGFSGDLVPLDISPKMRLTEVCKTIAQVRAGSTRCSLPMEWAMTQKIPNIGGFVIFTDNETNGGGHPAQALAEYRKRYSPKAKLAVMATASNGFTIADPQDLGMLDLPGFDSSSPSVLSEFLRG